MNLTVPSEILRRDHERAARGKGEAPRVVCRGLCSFYASTLLLLRFWASALASCR